MVTAKTLLAPVPSSTEPIHNAALGLEVFRGLTATPKTLSPWLFYDGRGSALFERITELPEYYLTRVERGIFAAHAAAILQAAAGKERLAVIELGAGTASKTGLLLGAAVAQQGAVDYYAIDVSESALREAERHLAREIPGVQVHTRIADYTDGLGLIDAPGLRKLVLYIGSSIGNFEPQAASELLTAVRGELARGDRLLLGADLVKEQTLLLAAYNDSEGVTADFNLNVLDRINRELAADFVLGAWAHEARWNARESRMEMHLCSRAGQTVSIRKLDLTISFAAGETIHTENSYKFTDAMLLALFESAGFALRQAWKDDRSWFGVYLAEAV